MIPFEPDVCRFFFQRGESVFFAGIFLQCPDDIQNIMAGQRTPP